MDELRPISGTLDDIAKIKSHELRDIKIRTPSNWRLFRDVLLFHPSPIARHEAAFYVGEFGISELFPLLIYAVENDKSLVVKH